MEQDGDAHVNICSHIKWTALQKQRLEGGWAVPKSKLYHWSFTLQHIRHWLDPEADAPWLETEKHLVTPMRLHDLHSQGYH